MFGQGAHAHSIEVQWFVQSAFSMANFFFKYFVRKNWRGGGELLNWNRKMVQWMVTPTNHVIAEPNLHCALPLALWRFSQNLSAKYK